MTGLLLSVIGTSLLGSAHCAGMCGGFVTLACGGSPRVRFAAAYNLGRLSIYAALGGLAGAFGSMLDLSSAALGLQRGAALLAGVSMAVFGACLLAQEWGARGLLPAAPARLQRVYVRAVAGLNGVEPLTRAGLLGVLSALLPCGWLYAFVLVAAGTGHPLAGVVAMAAFWLGTLPALALIGVLLRRMESSLVLNLRRTLPLLLIAMGLLTAATRGTLQLDAAVLSREQRETSVEHLERVAARTPACCTEAEHP